MVATSHQQEIIEHFQQLISYVSRKVLTAPKAQGKVRDTPSLPELAKLLDQKKIDFFMGSPYSTYVVNQVYSAAGSCLGAAGMAAENKAGMRILAQTDLLLRHLVSVRKDMSVTASQRLARILQEMNEDGEGQKILLDMDNTTKFDPL